MTDQRHHIDLHGHVVSLVSLKRLVDSFFFSEMRVDNGKFSQYILVHELKVERRRYNVQRGWKWFSPYATINTPTMDENELENDRSDIHCFSY